MNATTSHHVKLPRALMRAAKVEARRSGATLRDVIERLLIAWLRESPTWRAFLARYADAPEAAARGRLSKTRPTPQTRYVVKS